MTLSMDDTFFHANDDDPQAFFHSVSNQRCIFHASCVRAPLSGYQLSSQRWDPDDFIPNGLAKGEQWCLPKMQGLQGEGD